MLLSLPLPPIFCSPCLYFSYLSPAFLPTAENTPSPRYRACFLEARRCSHCFPTLPVMHVFLFSSLTALLSLCILILIIIPILVLDDFLLDLLGRTFLFSLIIFAGVFIILLLNIILTTSLLALCCTLLSSSSSSRSFRTDFLDNSGGGRSRGAKFLDLIF